MTEYYSNGLLCKYEINSINSLSVCYWESYHPNGNLRTKGNYVEDIIHGYWEEYNSDGELINQEIYL